MDVNILFGLSMLFSVIGFAFLLKAAENHTFNLKELHLYYLPVKQYLIFGIVFILMFVISLTMMIIVFDTPQRIEGTSIVKTTSVNGNQLVVIPATIGSKNFVAYNSAKLFDKNICEGTEVKITYYSAGPYYGFYVKPNPPLIELVE